MADVEQLTFYDIVYKYFIDEENCPPFIKPTNEISSNEANEANEAEEEIAKFLEGLKEKKDNIVN